jgi:hypothetical protein
VGRTARGARPALAIRRRRPAAGPAGIRAFRGCSLFASSALGAGGELLILAPHSPRARRGPRRPGARPGGIPTPVRDRGVGALRRRPGARRGSGGAGRARMARGARRGTTPAPAARPAPGRRALGGQPCAAVTARRASPHAPLAVPRAPPAGRRRDGGPRPDRALCDRARAAPGAGQGQADGALHRRRPPRCRRDPGSPPRGAGQRAEDAAGAAPPARMRPAPPPRAPAPSPDTCDAPPQANRAVPGRQLLFYFEVTVLDQGELGKIGVGFTPKDVKLTRQPG